jgi:hypothetical protein
MKSLVSRLEPKNENQSLQFQRTIQQLQQLQNKIFRMMFSKRFRPFNYKAVRA